MLKEHYNQKVRPELMKELGITNIFRAPRLVKIVVNSCFADALTDKKVLETAARDLAMITGQKAAITTARKSIASFKLRQGQQIGCMVTLRGRLMYEFFNRLVNVALPRSRDFKGLSKKGFDGRGNYTLGVKEHIIFPEILSEKAEKNWGMNVTLVTTGKTDQEGEALLRKMGFPLRS